MVIWFFFFKNLYVILVLFNSSLNVKIKNCQRIKQEKNEGVKWKNENKLYRPGLTHEIYNLGNEHDHNELT